jgi:Flp pilus assembly protein TadD
MHVKTFLPVTLALVLTAGSLGCATSLQRSSEQAALSARKRLVRELIAREDWQNALAHVTELYRQRPEDPEVLTLRGTVFRERQLLDEAEADLRAALATDDGLAEAHAALGILLDGTGRGADADRHHRRAVALDGKNATYLNNLGFSLLVRRKTREAVETLQRSARLDPTNRRLRTNLGFAYAAAGDFPRAAHEFELGASAAEAKNNLGFAYESRGHLQNAYELYAQALQLDPGCQRARTNLGHVAQRLGRPVAALPAAPDFANKLAPAAPASEEAIP